MKGAFLSWHVKMKGYTTIASGWSKDEDEGFREILGRYPHAIEIWPRDDKTLSGGKEQVDTICSNYIAEYGQFWPFCVYCGQERNKHPIKANTPEGAQAAEYIANPVPFGSRELPYD